MSNFDEILKQYGWSPASFSKALVITPQKQLDIKHDNHLQKRMFSPPVYISNSINRVNKHFNSNSTPLVRMDASTEENLSFCNKIYSLEKKDDGVSIDLTNLCDSPMSYTETKDIELLTCKLEKHTMNDSFCDDDKENNNNCLKSDTNCESTKFITARELFSKKSDDGCSMPEFSSNYSNNSMLARNKIYFKSKHEIKEEIINAAHLNEDLPNGWKLMTHQKDSIIRCIHAERSILALDMGLGKTLVSLCWAKAVCSIEMNTIVLVIAPCTLGNVWRREGEMLGFTCYDTISWNRHSKAIYNQNNPNKFQLIISSWAKVPTVDQIIDLNKAYAQNRFLLIGDEAHAMQTLSSQRTQAALKLCLHQKCIGCVLATGTPMKNGRPANILPLLMGIRHEVARNKIEFEKRYCNAKKTKFCPWDTTGSSNLEELRKCIEERLIRKTKVTIFENSTV